MKDKGARRKRRTLLLPLFLPLLLLTAGCAHTRIETDAGRTHGISSIKATAIVEFTKEDTEKGRAVISVSKADTFRIEIKGPLGTTVARISGSRDDLTFLWRGEKRTFSRDDPRLPFNIRAVELASLLLGKKDFPPGDGNEFETRELPEGRIIIKRINNKLLYRVVMKDYRLISGHSLPFNITVEGGGYKLLVKYIKVDINPEIDNSYSKRAH